MTRRQRVAQVRCELTEIAAYLAIEQREARYLSASLTLRRQSIKKNRLRKDALLKQLRNLSAQEVEA